MKPGSKKRNLQHRRYVGSRKTRPSSNPYYTSHLSGDNRDLVEACYKYYSNGTPPPVKFVPKAPPAMVDKETTNDRMGNR
jgi:hypothetical protein